MTISNIHCISNSKPTYELVAVIVIGRRGMSILIGNENAMNSVPVHCSRQPGGDKRPWQCRNVRGEPTVIDAFFQNAETPARWSSYLAVALFAPENGRRRLAVRRAGERRHSVDSDFAVVGFDNEVRRGCNKVEKRICLIYIRQQTAL